MTVLATACGGGGDSDADADADEVSLANASSSTTESPETTSTTTTTEPPTTTSTTTTTTTAAPAPTDEEQILAVVDLYWHAGIEANDPPDPNHPLLSQVAAGELLDSLREVARSKLEEGEGNRYRDGRVEVVRRAAMIGIDGTVAGVDVCIVDNTLVYDLATGDITNEDTRIGWVQHAVELTPEGWRVVRANVVSRFDTEEECESAF